MSTLLINNMIAYISMLYGNTNYVVINAEGIMQFCSSSLIGIMSMYYLNYDMTVNYLSDIINKMQQKGKKSVDNVTLVTLTPKFSIYNGELIKLQFP